MPAVSISRVIFASASLMRASAVHDGKQLGIRLRWDDATEDGPGGELLADAIAVGVRKTPTFIANGQPLQRFGVRELEARSAPRDVERRRHQRGPARIPRHLQLTNQGPEGDGLMVLRVEECRLHGVEVGREGSFTVDLDDGTGGQR